MSSYYAFVLLLTLMLFNGAAVTEQKRPNLAYDSKMYDRPDARSNKVGFLNPITELFWSVKLFADSCMRLAKYPLPPLVYIVCFK